MSSRAQSAGDGELQVGSHAIVRPVHFVGSIPFANATEVFAQVGQRVGSAAHAVPDGETGERLGWIRWHRKRLAQVPGFELIPKTVAETASEEGRIRVAPGVRVSDLELRPLGYLDEARKSYEDFKRARANGSLAGSTRMQVSIPSPIALSIGVDGPFFDLVTGFQKAVISEVIDLCQIIPSEDLAIQWDVCAETIAEIGQRAPGTVHATGQSLLGRWTFEQSMASVTAICDAVPASVPVGIHLCYGDPDGQALARPPDCAVVRDIANEISRRVSRQIDWVHIPAPADRNDDAFFAPLADLKLRQGTQLFIGLVHQHDELADAKARIDAVRKHVESFGIATECGLGRGEPSAIPALLDFHAAVARLP